MTEDIKASVSEDYYQISEPVLLSFSKYRLPLDLFVFQEAAAVLMPYYQKESRLSDAQVEEIRQKCKEGLLFVSRSDYPIYSEHIMKQLDLVLMDANLKSGEVADIIIRALQFRLGEFFDQPVKPVFEVLYSDCMVFTEYLWTDRYRLKLFLRRLHQGEHSLSLHSLNTMMIGLRLLFQLKAEISRKEFDACAIAFLLHDVGMSKVGTFITSKTKPLTVDEKDKIKQHVLTGMNILQKLEQVSAVVKEACLEHHERIDGSGYPQKLGYGATGKIGSICAVADSFSAMIQKRPYAEAKAPLSAARELLEQAGQYPKDISASLVSIVLDEIENSVSAK